MNKRLFSFQRFRVQKNHSPSVLETENQCVSASYMGKGQLFGVGSATVGKAKKPRTLKTCRAFTLFEVLIALGVFAIAVTGLAIALDSAVMAAFEARERALARFAMESRLSACMSDPPLSGRRVIEARDNNGVRVEEEMEKFEIRTTNGTPLSGLWKIKISADWGRQDQRKESAEILLYKP